MKSWRCKRQQRVERGVPLVGRVGEDDPLDQLRAIAEEHVLGAAQADALCAELARPGRVLGGVGVRPHAEPAHGCRRASAPGRRP